MGQAKNRARLTLRRSMPLPSLWRLGLRHEARWWRDYLRTRGAQWPEEFEQRFDPDARLTEPLVADRVARFGRDEVSVLDVGAGPASVLGRRCGTVSLRLTAVDPLAEQYQQILAHEGLTPPVPTEPCEGERLVERFGTDRFSIAFARNSLDHAVDPLAIIRQMIAVVEPGGFVDLRHYRPEGLNTNYNQLHNWNFDVVDGRLELWGPFGRHDVSDALGDRVAVQVWVEDTGGLAPWVCAVIEKPASPE